MKLTQGLLQTLDDTRISDVWTIAEQLDLKAVRTRVYACAVWGNSVLTMIGIFVVYFSG